MMNKDSVRSFFDAAAPGWDADMVTDSEKLTAILDAAGVGPGSRVLDVACGTGVLFPWYLRRQAGTVLGVDLSPEMVRIAAGKVTDPRIRVLCADMETLPVTEAFDCCVVYNAFPHFEDPERLVSRLALWVRPGGRIAIAHSMGLETLRRHHAGAAKDVSREMLPAPALTALLEPWFAVDTAVSDADKYIVAGTRR